MTAARRRRPARGAVVLAALAGLGVLAAVLVHRAVPPVPAGSPPVPSFSLPPPRAVPTGPTVTAEAFGARGDGSSDDTAALQSALDAVPPGGRLVLAAGRTYAHADVLTVHVGTSTVTGGGTLLATDPKRSAVHIDADGVTIAGITLACRSPDRRYAAHEQMGLWISGRRGPTIQDVRVERSAAAGIFLEDVADFTIRDVRISDTQADGIHITDGSHDGTVIGPVITRPGDDGVGVVSYATDRAPTERIQVIRPTVTDQVWGRGLSVVGGQDITYADVTVDGSAGAAIYIATESAPYFTRSVADVRVFGGRISRANSRTDVRHGAVLIYVGQSGTTVTDVTVDRLTITHPPAGTGAAVALRCEAGTASGLSLREVTVSAAYSRREESSCPEPRTLDLRTGP